jgi:hypothetical protein
MKRFFKGVAAAGAIYVVAQVLTGVELGVFMAMMVVWGEYSFTQSMAVLPVGWLLVLAQGACLGWASKRLAAPRLVPG